MFGWFALLSMLAAGIGLDYWRFRRNHTEENADEPVDFSGWLAARAAALTGPARLESAADFFHRRIIQPYPGWWKWVAAALAAGFLLMAATGLGFAVIGVRLQGLPLMAHVGLGAVFAPSLAAVLIRRARAHSPTAARAGLKAGLFWLFILCAWLLIVSALAMMLPVSSFRAQINLFHIHRWAALASVLCAMAFLAVTAAGPRRDA